LVGNLSFQIHGVRLCGKARARNGEQALEDCLWLQFGLHEDLVHRHVKEPISFECHRSRLSAIKSIPPGKFQIRLGKNASGHASQVERSRISSSVENLNIPRGSVYNHRFLHEIFIYEAANFAPIHPTQLGSWFENFDGSVFSELI